MFVLRILGSSMVTSSGGGGRGGGVRIDPISTQSSSSNIPRFAQVLHVCTLLGAGGSSKFYILSKYFQYHSRVLNVRKIQKYSGNR